MMMDAGDGSPLLGMSLDTPGEPLFAKRERQCAPSFGGTASSTKKERNKTRSDAFVFGDSADQFTMAQPAMSSDVAGRRLTNPFQIELDALSPLDPKFSDRLNSWEGALPPAPIPEDASGHFGQVPGGEAKKRTDTDFQALCLDAPVSQRLGFWEEQKEAKDERKDPSVVRAHVRDTLLRLFPQESSSKEWGDMFNETLNFWQTMESESAEPASLSASGSGSLPFPLQRTPAATEVHAGKRERKAPIDCTSSSASSPTLSSISSPPSMAMINTYGNAAPALHSGPAQLTLQPATAQAPQTLSLSPCPTPMQVSRSSSAAGTRPLPQSRKMRKSTREKMRRLELKEGFEALARMLEMRDIYQHSGINNKVAVGSQASSKKPAEKVHVLSEAINLIKALKKKNQELLKDKALLRHEMVNLTRCLDHLARPTPGPSSMQLPRRPIHPGQSQQAQPIGAKYPFAAQVHNGSACIKPSAVVSIVRREAPALAQQEIFKKAVVSNIASFQPRKRQRFGKMHKTPYER